MLQKSHLHTSSGIRCTTRLHKSNAAMSIVFEFFEEKEQSMSHRYKTCYEFISLTIILRGLDRLRIRPNLAMAFSKAFRRRGRPVRVLVANGAFG